MQTAGFANISMHGISHPPDVVCTASQTQLQGLRDSETTISGN